MTTRHQSQGLGEFAAHGFTLEHPDDHILLLMHQGEVLGMFSQTGATAESIQDECAEHLVTKHGWNKKNEAQEANP